MKVAFVEGPGNRTGGCKLPERPINKRAHQAANENGGEKILAQLESGEIVHEDLINEVLHRTVRDNAIPMVISTKPIWFDTAPWVRVAHQFKSWPLNQVGLLWNDVIKYTVKTAFYKPFC